MVLLQISKKERQLSLLKKNIYYLASNLYKTALAVIFGNVVPKSF